MEHESKEARKNMAKTGRAGRRTAVRPMQKKNYD